MELYFVFEMDKNTNPKSFCPEVFRGLKERAQQWIKACNRKMKWNYKHVKREVREDQGGTAKKIFRPVQALMSVISEKEDTGILLL
jgi:hypothetical protein